MSTWWTPFQAGLRALETQDWPLALQNLEDSLQMAAEGSSTAGEQAQICHELAYAALKAGQPERAEAAYRQALQFQPDSIEDLNNLALLLQQKAPEQAQFLLERALSLPGLDPETELQLGLNWVETVRLRHPQRAFDWLNKAYQRFPQDTRIQALLAEMAENWLQYPLVIQICQTTLSLLPTWAFCARAKAWRRLARAYQAMGEIQQAHWALQAAQDCHPSPAFPLEKALLLPQFYTSEAEIRAWRAKTEAALAELEQGPPLAIAHPLEDLQTAPFFLAFQGFDDRSLLEKLAAIYRRFLPVLPTRPIQMPVPIPVQEPIRIGFLSHFFFDHSVLHLFEGLICGLDPALFEVTVFAVAPLFCDARTEALAAQVAHFILLQGTLAQMVNQIQAHSPQVAHFILLQGTLAQMVNQIQAHSPEVLVYTDLGSDPFTWILAQYRLAPLQLVLPGIMHTTGFSSLDYYLAPDCMEPPGAEDHYSETLHRMATLPVMPVCPRRSEPLLSREELGLPADRRVYLCPMTPFKFHPAFDAVLVSILTQDPKAEIWILQHRQDGICQKIKNRICQAWQDAVTLSAIQAERIVLAPWYSPARFLHLLEQVDVVLDSWPVVGGNTVFTCLGLGIPLVSWASPYFRGRVATGAYRLMGITAPPMAKNAEDCARLALKLAQDKHWRAELQSQILAKHAVLFKNPASLAEFSDFVREKVLSFRMKPV